MGNGSPAQGGAAGAFRLDLKPGPEPAHSPFAHLSPTPSTYPSIAEPDKASLTRTEPRSQRHTQAARKWRPGLDGNCRRCRGARGSARQRRRRKEPSARAPGCRRRAAGRWDLGEWAPQPLPLPRHRAPQALGPLCSGPGPAASWHGVAREAFWTPLYEPPAVLPGQCAWATSQACLLQNHCTALHCTASTQPPSGLPSNLFPEGLPGPLWAREELLHGFPLCPLVFEDFLPAFKEKAKTLSL